MKDFHESHVRRTAENEKKERKIKGHFHTKELCRCFPPVKLHCHNCPMVMQPCPIHGNLHHTDEKVGNGEREQNVVISFHPSSKTERLIQPIKNLLTHCNSETKINFQYYSPGNSLSKESLQHRNGSNVYECFKKSFNNNMFVEKTKSFVVDKTSKVKKLKHCFHSPCNSIAHKTRSQTSVKERLEQIFQEEAKQTNLFYNLVSEVSSTDKKSDLLSKWFYSNVGSFKTEEKLDGKRDSDFITVTQYDKKNLINHKVFEIKHNKEEKDFSVVGIPQHSTQLLYSTVDVGNSRNEKNPPNTPKKPANSEQRFSKRKSFSEGTKEPTKNRVEYSSEKTHRSTSSSSTSSVYITPFFLFPKGTGDDKILLADQEKKNEVEKVDEAVQVKDLPPQVAKLTQTSPQPSKEHQAIEPDSKPSVSVQTDSKPSVSVQPDSKPSVSVKPDSKPPVSVQPESKPSVSVKPDSKQKSEEPKTKSVLLQTEFSTPEPHQTASSTLVQHYKSAGTTAKESFIENDRSLVAKSHHTQTKQSNTESERWLRKCQGSQTQYQEVSVIARFGSDRTDQTSQTEKILNVEVSVKTLTSGSTRSQGTVPRFNDKQMQTSFSQVCPPSNHSYEDEVLQLNSPNVTYVIKPYQEEESEQDMQNIAKKWWGKSHSDTDLCERLKCCECKFSETTPQDSTKNVEQIEENISEISKPYQFTETSPEKETSSKNCGVIIRTEKTIEHIVSTKETCTKEGELSTPLSDLSELKRLIQEYFEGSKKPCECEKAASKPEKQVEKVDNGTMTEKVSQNVTAGVQTDIRELLNQSAKENAEDQDLKVCQCIKVDSKNQRKTLFVCSMCLRKITTADAQTNTEKPLVTEETKTSQTPEKKEIYEIEVHTKKIKSGESGKVLANSTPTSNGKEWKVKKSHVKTYQPQNTPRVLSAPKSAIPVPLPSSYARYCENDINGEKIYEKKTRLNSASTRDCLNEQVESFLTTHCISLCTGAITKSKSKEMKVQEKSDQTREDQQKQGPGRSCNGNRKNTTKKDYDFYPVIITRGWPKEFLRTWQSMDTSNEIPFNSKFHTLKQKRSCEKDVESVAKGKKIKVEFEERTKQQQPHFDINFPFKGMTAFHAQEEDNSSDEIPEKVPSRENSLETDHEIPGELSDGFISSEVLENSCFEEEEEEVALVTPDWQPYGSSPDITPQTHSTLNGILYAERTLPASKSLNTFWFVGEPKKKKNSKKRPTREY